MSRKVTEDKLRETRFLLNCEIKMHSVCRQTLGNYMKKLDAIQVYAEELEKGFSLHLITNPNDPIYIRSIVKQEIGEKILKILDFSEESVKE